MFVIAPSPPYIFSLHFPHHFRIPKTKSPFILRRAYLIPTNKGKFSFSFSSFP